MGDPTRWQSWRHFGSIPILFYSREDAEKYVFTANVFHGLRDKKPSLNIQAIRIRKYADPE